MNRDQFRSEVEQIGKDTLGILDRVIRDSTADGLVVCANETMRIKTTIEKLIEVEMDLITQMEESQYTDNIIKDLVTMLGLVIIGCGNPRQFSEDVQKISILLIKDRLEKVSSTNTNPSNSINGKGEELIKEFEEKANA
jgi:hypothetical protein